MKPNSSHIPDRDLQAQSQELDLALLKILSIPLFTMLTAMGAQIAIPVEPFGVPVTLQTLAVLLAAMALGPKLGSASMLLYFVMGAIGVGVFADGAAGWRVIFGSTGGYIFGFLLCQPLAHLLIRRDDGTIRGWLALFGAGIALHMFIFTLGVSWLYLIINSDSKSDPITLYQAIHGGFIIFIPGMLLKSGIAAAIAAYLLPSVARKLW